MAGVEKQPENWQTLPWKQFQQNVYRLQQRIYRAERRGDRKQVHNLQRLLMRSWSARYLAVRQVAQDNRGKKTPGVDGVASLTPKQRLKYAHRLERLPQKADPVRRVYIPKPNNPNEQRPLGIPTLYDRVAQALVKLALEPEWKARFEPNSYGFRPGRCAQDAIEAIFKSIHLKPKYVLDADIEKCFDKIDREALLEKLVAIQPITKVVRAWLKAGILDNGEMLFPEAGVPQGGVISPLLANVALHGLENHLVSTCPHPHKPGMSRYADDFVVLHEDYETLQKLREQAETWLAGMGLRLKPEKTHIRHTLQTLDGQAGFDFLGFNIRQFLVGKYHTTTFRDKPGFKTLIKPSRKAQKHHQGRIGEVIQKHRSQAQVALITNLNPIIRGWSNYYRSCVAKKIFNRMDHQVHYQLFQWARHRHPNRTAGWRFRHYWRCIGKRITFNNGTATLIHHAATPIQRHIKVRGDKSPFDGDWQYWVWRLVRTPGQLPQWAKVLKRQGGKCAFCGLCFTTNDVMELHHRDHNHNHNKLSNLALLHGYCHDQIHRDETCL